MLKEYLKSRFSAILLLLLPAAIFASSYLLFDMKAITVIYPLVLYGIILLVIGFIDFLRVRSIHRRLMREDLPEPGSLIERDYRAIIEKLKEEEQVSRKRAASDYSDRVEYYTVWAHQIKTPIAAMRLNLQSEDSDLARKLEGDLNRIESYVEMAMTFLRLDSDSTDYVIREHALDDIIRPAIRRFSREFILKKLTMDFRPTGYTVLTDEKWLAFVMEQILSNAVKYTIAGGVRVFMNAPGILCIEDTGIGISPEDLPRIFENGYTGFNGREDKRASGIGLYLCRRVCDNLGHGITAESEPGKGTRFLLDLNTRPVGID